MDYSVKLQGVTKKFKMHSKSSDKLKDLLYPGGYGEDFYALRNISFEAKPGDVVGLIGVNGSGKSTISNLISGITMPTLGTIETQGQVSLIAIAAGMNNQLTGRENIELKCLMMGLSKEQIDEIKPNIIEFADIGKFIDMPVKKYSSGMKSRLGFAISVNINPDILVIDEALSVGDQTFADKCLKKMNEFKEQGKTIFFVSHSLAQIKKFCTKALWLEYGEVRAYDTVQEVLPKYEEFLKEYRAMSKKEQRKFKEEAMRKQAGEAMQLEEPRQTKRRKRTKYVIPLLFITASLIAGMIVYAKKDNLAAPKQVNKSPQENVMNKVEKEVVRDIPIRYVNAPAARVRETPSKEGEQIDTLRFGQSFVVRETQKDKQNGVWYNVLYDDGTEGWISEIITEAIPAENVLSYEDTVKELGEATGKETIINQAASILGNNRKDIEKLLEEPLKVEEIPAGTLVQYPNLSVLYNKQEKAIRSNIEDLSLSVDILKAWKPAQLQGGIFLAWVARSDQYNLVFSATKASTMEQISISLIE
ncbi:teichoic acids export ABC transporter ATP-binding subunit TagH [Ectobacillus funiculus]|uniref:teichoic acids export ABC transporter ATP-binding subunit TagH n=1 Tax=Ectobacillus funiculus TaxID=137993 RepID=UPI00397CD371